MDFLERTDSRPRLDWRALALGALAGGALFVAGLAAARLRLPEWHLPALPAAATLEERFRVAAARAGVEVLTPPRYEVEDGRSGQHNPYAVFGAEAARWIAERRRPVLFGGSAHVQAAEAGEVVLQTQQGLDGQLWRLTANRSGLGIMKPLWDSKLPDGRSALLVDGESLAASVRRSSVGTPLAAAAIEGSPDPETLLWVDTWNSNTWTAVRSPGSPDRVITLGLFQPAFIRAGLLAVLFLLVIVLAFVLAVRRRIDLVNAAVVTGLASGVSLVTTLLGGAHGADWVEFAFLAGLSALYLFFLWSAGESWLRVAGRESTSALDALRSGRVGRRVGRAAFWGLAVGAGAAGWRLLAYAAATLVPGGVPEDSSVALPLFHAGSTPLDLGLRVAGLGLLGLAVGRQFFRGRVATVAAVVVAGVIALPFLSKVQPWYLALALTLGTFALLNVAFERAGSLGIAVAGVVSFALPIFCFSLQSPAWFGAGLWGSLAILSGIGVVGLVGAFRPEAVVESVAAPSFVRRLEEEKRLQYETEILARIQEGLLPEELPRLEGWEFAARTIPAHEVGGDFYDFFTAPDGALWVAAGDVAGHGISCSITHAMTKAALAALIRSGETPARVLGEVDRVLRTLTTSRLFTSLALVRLDPTTGEGLFSNAGYPYPLRRESREVTELILPGLPVGEGPSRRYGDLEIRIPPGGALVFCSDGLAEALRIDGEPYGFERPRQVLAAAPARSAEDLLAALTADWHREIGPQAQDDTTVLVLRRRG